MGDLNVRLRELQDNREDEHVLALAGSGMGDVTANFTLRQRYRGIESWNWHMRWEVRMVTGRGDYTLNSDRDEFIKVGVREERLHTDHWMVLAVLRGEGMLRNSRYVVGRTKWPLAASMERPKTEGEAAFASLKGEAEQKNKPKALRNSWISKETCRLADWRAVLQREG